ncbi:MAG: hypothetical protein WC453_00915 [Patescibacteria group bacterium]
MPHFSSGARKLFFIFVLVIIFVIPVSLSVLDCVPPDAAISPADTVATGTPVVTVTSSLPVVSSGASLSPAAVQPAKPAGGSPIDSLAAAQQFGSFAYSQVNFHLSGSAIRFDNETRGLSFYPDYAMSGAGSQLLGTAVQKSLQDAAANDFNGPYADRRCLGNDCLEQKDWELFYNDRYLDLPLSSSSLTAVSIAGLQKIWLVGLTFRAGEGYRGRAFRFDGREFTEIVTPSPITSLYPGLFGFGGEDDDFLVLYSADQGTAYRIRGGRFTEAINISRFFNIRGPLAAFKAEAIKVVNGSDTVWYIYSSTLSRPRLLKLWQNRTAEIVGSLSFDNFPGSRAKAALFRKLDVSTGQIRLAALVRDYRGGEDWQIFSDRGFKNTKPVSLATPALGKLSGGAAYRIISIANSALDIDPPSQDKVKWLFSTDNKNWRTVPLGRNLEFKTATANSYFFRLDFPASGDKFFSPFISAIFFDYYFQK